MRKPRNGVTIDFYKSVTKAWGFDLILFKRLT